MTTKAQQILALYAECVGKMPDHKIPKYVAAQLGTTDSYVRTVARQRKGRSLSEAEQRYLDSPLGRKMLVRRNATRRHRRLADSEFRDRERAQIRAWRARRREFSSATEGQEARSDR